MPRKFQVLNKVFVSGQREDERGARVPVGRDSRFALARKTKKVTPVLQAFQKSIGLVMTVILPITKNVDNEIK